MSGYVWRYYLPRQGETLDDARPCPAHAAGAHDRLLAEEAARDLHEHHDGWEMRWPLDLVLVAPDGTTSRWIVDRRSEPVFEATQILREPGL